MQEIAFTLANGIAYVEAAIAAGMDVDAFAPRLSFFWNAHNNLFEEVAKYRAARRMWARIMTERFGAKDERSKMLRFHTQTGGSTLTAQQPENNIVRVTVQSLAAALGGTQSLHTNGFDEALGLPTTRAAKIALRTQQIVGFESGVADTVDPLAGSYFVESLTDEVEQAANDYLERIEQLGGAVAAIEARFMQEEIEAAAYSFAKSVDDGEKVVVGVNRFTDAEGEPTEVFPIDVKLQQIQIDRTRSVRAERDQAAVDRALADVAETAKGEGNLLVPMKAALKADGHPRRGVRRPAGGVRRLPTRGLSRGGGGATGSGPCSTSSSARPAWSCGSPARRSSRPRRAGGSAGSTTRGPCPSSSRGPRSSRRSAPGSRPSGGGGTGPSGRPTSGPSPVSSSWTGSPSAPRISRPSTSAPSAPSRRDRGSAEPTRVRVWAARCARRSCTWPSPAWAQRRR